MFEKLNLPSFQIRMSRLDNGSYMIYDPLRKKEVVATPEEWVRQHFVNFLINHCGFPKNFIVNEKGLVYNGMSRRCDTLIYSRDLRPVCIIEYKRPSIDLNRKVFDQIARYNFVIGAPYLIVSNGMKHYCVKYDENGYGFLESIPTYEEMCAR